MTLSDISIKNPVAAWMLMIGLIVFGWISFQRMGISQLPDVDFPVINVTVAWEGAAPEVMETEVTDVLEDAVMSIEGIQEVSSNSRQGQATITIEFGLDRDIDVALQEVQSKIAQAQRNLPREIDPPVVVKTNPEDQPIMWVSLAGDRPLRDLMIYTHDVLKNQFTVLPGVGEVFLGGYIDPNLRVWIDQKKMTEAQLTVDDILDAIGSQHEEVPSGIIDTGKREFNVRVMGEAATSEEFSRIVIPTRHGGGAIWSTVRIGDVATVEDGLNDARRISRNQLKPAIGLGIRKQRGSNAVAVAQGVKERVLELQNTLPEGMTLSLVFDSTKFIEESTSELTFTLVLSALLTGVVCWLFLGSWSSTVNVLLAIPTSIIGSFIVLNFMGFTLNTFTLLGLSLAIGIVVDDAIMVLENIVRYLEHGFSKVRAAIVGAREITFAAVAASIAILAIFLPVVFMKGIVGKFFYQFGVTMSVAVLLSLLEALTLAPMRCSQQLNLQSDNILTRFMDRFLGGLIAFYRRSLNWALDRRGLVVIGSIVIFATSLLIAKTIKKEFVPAQDEGRFLVRIQTPIGSSIGATDEAVRAAEDFLMHRPEIEQYYLAIGGFGGGEVNTAMMFITLKPRKERPIVAPATHRLSQQEIMAVVRDEFNKLPGVERAIAQDLSLSGFSAQRGFPVEFTIRGPDWDQLAAYSGTIMEKMKASGLMTDVDTDYILGMPELRVLPNREAASLRGVSIDSIGRTVNATIGGVRAGKYTQNGKRYDIRVRLTDKDRQRPEDIGTLWVRNQHGELVNLSDVTTRVEKPSLLSITRRNRERAIGIFANIAPGSSQAEALAGVQKIANEILPEGYHAVFTGSAKGFEESFQSLIFALILGLFVAYMVLGSQFNSFLHPVTVLLALPFSITGAFIALKLGGRSLNIYSMIGIVLLMGIVKKNSILLVDFTNNIRKKYADLEDRTKAVRESLLEACPLRLRPILMTSFATIAGAIPPALGLGPGAETRIPMALVVIGGVFLSTFLTLYVVPCVYSLLARFEGHKHEANLKEALKELGETGKEPSTPTLI